MTEQSTLLSVIIPAHNARHTIGEQIEALCNQQCSFPWELVVVDNLSTDDTGEIVKSLMRTHAHIRLIEARRAKGPAYARNEGVAVASSSWLAFCDADDVVGGDWLSAVAAGLSEHDFVTGPLDLDVMNPPWLANSRGRGFAESPTFFHSLFPYASSCNMGVRRAAFDGVGGFDESLTVGEDIDFSLRLHRMGVQLHFEPTQRVAYRLRPSLRGIFAQSRQYAAVQPLLIEQLRSEGEPVPARTSRLRSWAWLGTHLPSVRTKAGRARWLWVAGTQVGWVQGGARMRRLYL